jgi:D-sedoheptulose 7-phosphate isomerase
MEFSVKNYIKQHNKVLESLDQTDLHRAIDLIRDKAFAGKKIAVCGNGGSALTASHYITDWNKMVNLETGRCFNGICLSDNTGLITAYANDLSYGDVFSEQVKNLMLPGDLLITISGSGNSENVVRATEVANSLQITTLTISGYNGRRLGEISNYSVRIKSFDMQICEDAHVVFGHLVMKSICKLPISSLDVKK